MGCTQMQGVPRLPTQPLVFQYEMKCPRKTTMCATQGGITQTSRRSLIMLLAYGEDQPQRRGVVFVVFIQKRRIRKEFCAAVYLRWWKGECHNPSCPKTDVWSTESLWGCLLGVEGSSWLSTAHFHTELNRCACTNRLPSPTAGLGEACPWLGSQRLSRVRALYGL